MIPEVETAIGIPGTQEIPETSIAGEEEAEVEVTIGMTGEVRVLIITIL